MKDVYLMHWWHLGIECGNVAMWDVASTKTLYLNPSFVQGIISNKCHKWYRRDMRVVKKYKVEFTKIEFAEN
jgi:hypothetical protein